MKQSQIIILDYMTIHNDGKPSFGAFTYRLRGFHNQTTKHYFRHYQRRLQDRIRRMKEDDFCNGDKKGIKL